MKKKVCCILDKVSLVSILTTKSDVKLVNLNEPFINEQTSKTLVIDARVVFSYKKFKNVINIIKKFKGEEVFIIADDNVNLGLFLPYFDFVVKFPKVEKKEALLSVIFQKECGKEMCERLEKLFQCQKN